MISDPVTKYLLSLQRLSRLRSWNSLRGTTQLHGSSSNTPRRWFSAQLAAGQRGDRTPQVDEYRWHTDGRLSSSWFAIAQDAHHHQIVYSCLFRVILLSWSSWIHDAPNDWWPKHGNTQNFEVSSGFSYFPRAWLHNHSSFQEWSSVTGPQLVSLEVLYTSGSIGGFKSSSLNQISQLSSFEVGMNMKQMRFSANIAREIHHVKMTCLWLWWRMVISKSPPEWYIPKHWPKGMTVPPMAIPHEQHV